MKTLLAVLITAGLASAQTTGPTGILGSGNPGMDRTTINSNFSALYMQSRQVLSLPTACTQQYEEVTLVSQAASSRYLNTSATATCAWVQQSGLALGTASPAWTLDADLATGLKVGGGTATDNTAAINTALAAASSAMPIMLSVPGATVTSGVRIPPGNRNVLIRGNGPLTGFFTRSGSDSPGITNSIPSAAPWVPWDPAQFPLLNPGGTPTPSGSVYLEDFFLNGNRGMLGGNTGVVSGTLVNAGVAWDIAPGATEKGYDTLAPPGSPVIGAAAFPNSPVVGQWAIITNGTSGVNCGRSGTFRVACYWNGSAWVPGGAGNLGSYPWYTGIDLSNLAYVRMKNISLLDSPTYGARFTNVANVAVENFTCTQTTYAGTHTHDCLHFSGPANNISVQGGVYTNIDDDVIAANAPEGYGGTISNFTVSFPQYVNSLDGVNIYGDVVSSVLTGLQGSIDGRVLRVLGTGVGSVSLSDSIITAIPGTVYVEMQQTSMKSLSLTNNTLIGPGTVAAYATCYACGIDSLALHNQSLRMTTAYHASMPFVRIDTGGAAGTVTLDGLDVINATGNSYGISYAVDAVGTIGELVVNNISTRYIAALVNPSTGFTNISRISGAGLLSSGYQVPDAKVVNGVPYVSATTGFPSIKRGGTAGGLDGTITTIAAFVGPNGQLLAPINNSSVTPPYNFAAFPGSGMWAQNGNELDLSIQGIQQLALGYTGTGNASYLGLSRTSGFCLMTFAVSVDSCLTYVDSTTVRLGPGLSGGTPLRLTAIPNIPAGTIASPPASPRRGDLVQFTDAASATTCTSGSGSSFSVCVYNGTAWQKP